jgi:hypothetical protein
VPVVPVVPLVLAGRAASDVVQVVVAVRPSAGRAADEPFVSGAGLGDGF